MPLFVEETKTTSEDASSGSTYWKRLLLDPQASLYTRAAILLGYAVQGIRWNVLRRPAHRPSEAKRETPAGFQSRVLDAIAAEPSKYYSRGTVVRLESDLAESDRDVWLTAVSIREARRLNAWARNPDACMQYGRTCDFFPVCCGEAQPTDPVLYQIRKKRHAELDCATDDHLTQSSLRTFRACPRRFFYRYEMKLSSVRANPESMMMGTSIHRAVEWYGKSGGDIELAVSKLDSTDPFRRAKEAAMMLGYAAQWGEPRGVVSVEKEWETPLVNPETGATSRTFMLAGKLDALVNVDGDASSDLETSVKHDPETGEILDG